jgi:predicted DNA-binding antitoxin AbrB/MazE fold protein
MSNARTTKPGTVEKLIKPIDPSEPEKAQISIDGAEPLYKEIRIENKLIDEKGNEVKLKEGADVEVHVEADKNATTPKKD